jgi:dephospho-CoA kinase
MPLAEAPRRPLRIGLTGSIGMGKSETAKLFARLGIPAYDADAAVHRLYAKGGAAVAAIASAFPDAVVDGAVDRARLARAITADPAALRRLEALVHPLVAEERERFIAEAERAGADLVLLDIPLLFETGGETSVDAVVVVSAPRAVQQARVLARPGMTLEKLLAIEARQVPDEEKRGKADYVIDTSTGIEHAFESVKQIVGELRRRVKIPD